MSKTNNSKKLRNEISEPPDGLIRKSFNVSDKEWNNWKWQLKNSFTELAQIENFFTLSDKEREFFQDKFNTIPFRITPYYLNLVNPDNPFDSIRKTIFPSIDETVINEGEEIDPLGEENSLAVESVVHRYPDRVLFLVTDFCSVFCRYCTRSRMVGKSLKLSCNLEKIDNGIKYIKSNTKIRDVLLSGGDPLTLPTKTLEYILSELKKIEHVEMIRIGTKVPAVLPQRINKELLSMLKKYKPIYMSLHFTHPNELSSETIEACNKLADIGIPLGSQTVLLKGVNDDIETMRKLMTGLLKIRVRPYYLYQCDPISGSSHFRTTVEKGVEIIKGLRGHISGYGVPSYVIDAPKGGGKIPILPEYFMEKTEKEYVLRNYQDQLYYYPNSIIPNEIEGETKCLSV